MPLRPRLGGSGWRPLFTPKRTGCYVNDHCLVRGPGGRWHVFGISKATPELDPHQERWFCHGSGASLAGGEFEEHGRVCDFGARAWAPTIGFDGERWVMLYGPDRLRAAVCDDERLDHWREAACSLAGAPVEGVLRDGMLLRLDDDSWLDGDREARPRGRCPVSVSRTVDWRFVAAPARGRPRTRLNARSPARARRHHLSITCHWLRRPGRVPQHLDLCRATRSTSAPGPAPKPSSSPGSRPTRPSTSRIPRPAAGT
jgi:hypothetical protein